MKKFIIIKKGESKERELMAIASSYAMVRNKGCVPYVVTLKELYRDYDMFMEASEV